MERMAGLILLSLALYAPLTAEEQELPVPLWLYDALFASDFPLWAVQRARYMTLETIAPMSNDPFVSLPALASWHPRPMPADMVTRRQRHHGPGI
jgi:hypothetical protein